MLQTTRDGGSSEMADKIDAAGMAGGMEAALPLDGDRWTALWRATHDGDLGVVQHLLKKGADPTLPGELNGVTGVSTLYVAAFFGHSEVVWWLADHGGPVAQPDDNGVTPLSAAASKGHLAVVQWLVCNGGSITQRSNNGLTAHDVATRLGHDDVAAFLAATSAWVAFKGMVARGVVGDARLALRSGRLDPHAGPGSLAELLAVAASQPDVSPATRDLVHDAMGHWTPARHFLFHAGVRTSIRVVLLSANRVRDRCNVPTELWEQICSFMLRSDWEVPPSSAHLLRRAHPGWHPLGWQMVLGYWMPGALLVLLFSVFMGRVFPGLELDSIPLEARLHMENLRIAADFIAAHLANHR